MVPTKSKAILGVEWSRSPDHDYPIGRKLVKQIGKQTFSNIRRNYGDKAYTGGKLEEDLEKFGVRHIVEPKSNVVDHGTDSARDRSVRLYQKSPSLWKYSNMHNRKSVVEQVFGKIKIKKNGFNSRKQSLLKKQILPQFLMYNLAKPMEMQYWR